MKIILKNHRLTHIHPLTIGENLFNQRFAPGCSMSNCDGTCCKFGVYADIAEQKKIFEHTEMIQRYMEPQQEHDPQQWFEREEIEDKDFPSGRAIGTRATEYGCVFLEAAGRCTLQRASLEEGMPPFSLKPFYCVAFPVVINNGELILDDIELENRPPCCIISPGGSLDVFEVCAMELEYVLGKDGVEELRQIAKQYTAD